MAKTLISLLALFTMQSPLLAQVMRDPTQPPPAYTAGYSGPAEEAASTPAERTLQSIIRRHGAKPLAMINGQALPVGGKVDDWTVVRIGESQVELKGPGGRETLMLSPAVDKQPVLPATVRRQR